MTQPGLPGLDGLAAILSDVRGARAFIIPLVDVSGQALGNNGDDLMHAVFRRILAEFDISPEPDPSRADILVVPPNGALLEQYSFPELLRKWLERLPDRELIVFPSSMYFPTADPSRIFGDRQSSTRIILRESHSLAHLSSQWGTSLESRGVQLHLDHDVVASGHQFVPEIIDEPSRSDYLLVSARRDKEASNYDLHATSTGRAHALRSAPARALDLVPYGRMRTTLARLAKAQANRAAAKSLVDAIPESQRPPADWSIESARVVDLSARHFATFGQYRKGIAHASVVATNRLHVALPAAILGKQVVLVEAGYYKLQGVYERSLSTLDNVQLVVPVVARA